MDTENRPRAFIERNGKTYASCVICPLTSLCPVAKMVQTAIAQIAFLSRLIELSADESLEIAEGMFDKALKDNDDDMIYVTGTTLATLTSIIDTQEIEGTNLIYKIADMVGESQQPGNIVRTESAEINLN